MICSAADITGVDWNGYLKYFRPSKRFIESRQKAFADSLLHRQAQLKTVFAENGDETPGETFSPMAKRCVVS